MTRAQWIQKIELLDKLVEIGDITKQMRLDVLDVLIDEERQEWDKMELEHFLGADHDRYKQPDRTNS